MSTPGGGARLSKESLAPAPPARPVSPGVGDLAAPSPPSGSKSNSSSPPVPDTREAVGSLLPISLGDLNNPDIFQF